jgi:hypothetical protein
LISIFPLGASKAPHDLWPNKHNQSGGAKLHIEYEW